MTELTCCQSCGLPFDEGHQELIAREADGTAAPYCTYCYQDGAFLNPDATAQDMIDIGVSHLAVKVGERAAREQLTQFVPTLARWRG